MKRFVEFLMSKYFQKLINDSSAIEIRKLKKELNRLKAQYKGIRDEVFGCRIQMVMYETGWDRVTTVEKIKDAKLRTGCSYKEYYGYKLYELSDTQQENMLLNAINKPLATKYNVDKSFVGILGNKAKTNAMFSYYIKRPFCINKKITYDEFLKMFSSIPRIIYKPLNGIGGRDVCDFDLTVNDLKDVHRKVVSYPIGIVEEYVVQHPTMLKLNPSSVNTLRIVTLSSNSVPVTADGKYMDIAYTSLRIGGGTSIVDNFHSGGMVANVDMGTGRIVTDAVDDNRNVFTHHPLTGIQFRGFKIPYYREALDMVLEAITKNRVQGYLGWDVAITKDGPVLIEINTNPGVMLLTSPYVPEKKGMKHILAKYL